MTPFSDLDVTASATGAIDTRVEGYFSSSPFSVERRITLKAFFSALRKLSVKAVLGLRSKRKSALSSFMSEEFTT